MTKDKNVGLGALIKRAVSRKSVASIFKPKINPPPFNLAAVEEATKLALADGHRLLQTHFYHQDPKEHVRILLNLMALKRGDLIIDAGCGIGETSLLMSDLRPDLRFILANISQMQLDMCPRGPQYHHVLTDCHNADLPNGEADWVMYNSSLVQMDYAAALKDAYRVLKPGGRLFINEIVNASVYSTNELERQLAFRVVSQEQMMDFVCGAGFDVTRAVFLPFESKHFIDKLPDESRAMWLMPMVLTAIKKG